jgi:hypothetical protein
MVEGLFGAGFHGQQAVVVEGGDDKCVRLGDVVIRSRWWCHRRFPLKL